MDTPRKLRLLQRASGLSQVDLARRLGVSFATLNSWINGRSKPRELPRRRIEVLSLELLGADSIDPEELIRTKQNALKQRIKVGTLIKDKTKLDRLILLLTYHTNTIEGSTMTLADTEAVIFGKKTLGNRTQVEQLEARNHQAALLWLLNELLDKDFGIDESSIKQLHTRLMNGILSDAGKYRIHSVRIAGAKVVLANYVKIPQLLTTWVDSISNTTSKDHISQIARAHSEFEQIHPFSDGNGRVGRLLMLAMALQGGLFPPIVQKERKFAYYKYLESAQVSRNLSGLELLVAQSMIEGRESVR